MSNSNANLGKISEGTKVVGIWNMKSTSISIFEVKKLVGGCIRLCIVGQ